MLRVRTSSSRPRARPRLVLRRRDAAFLQAPPRAPRSAESLLSGGGMASPVATVFGTVRPEMTVSTEDTSAGRLAALRARYAPILQRSDTAKAAGLAAAMIANNVLALGSTVVFARLLTDYGSLGALISYLLILTVAGQAMQVATAREGVLGHLGLGRGLTGTMWSWTRALLLLAAGLTVASVLLRYPIASAVR